VTRAMGRRVAEALGSGEGAGVERKACGERGGSARRRRGGKAGPGGKVHAMCIIIVVHSVDILQIQVRGQCLKGMNWKLKRRKRMRKKDTKRRKTRKREQRKMRRTRMKSRRRKQKRGEQW
ncbi:unnamed protein product, partial [Closterium sp. NIES-54]